MKKIIVLFVAAIFAFGIGFAFAEDDTVNPWQGTVQTSVKKEDKAATKAVKQDKKEVKKTNAGKVKKKKTAKAENVSKTSAEKKESAQK